MYHLHLAQMLCAGGHGINARGIDAGVAKDVRKLGNILFNTVKRTRKQVPQIVRKHLAWQYVCLLAQRFHQTPHMMTADRLSISGSKDASLLNIVRFGIL